MSGEQAPWRRQSSQISGGGNTPSPGPPTSGDEITESNIPPSFPAPPPPPPPPPGPATLPTVRLNTEIPDSRRGGGGYEPPAAIQNAMMTKDKKPFTYTPGGLDLSQIRSPRMQRRITRNANAEGVSNEPAQAASMKTSPLAQSSPQGPLPPSAVAAMQPQMAVPVFPTGGSGGAPQLHHVNMPPGSHSAPTPTPPPPPPPAPVPVEQPPVTQPVSNVIPKTITPVIRPVQSSAPKPEPPKVSPPVAKVAVPPSPVEVLNEPGSIYVPPVTSRSQVGSLYIPPITNNTQQEAVSPPLRQQTPQSTSPMSPIPTLNKAPTPWMSQAQKQQQQQNVPSWVAKEEPQQPTGATRIIPIQVEGRSEPVQLPQPPPSQVQQQHQAVNQAQTRIIPIQIEGSITVTNNTSSQPKQQVPSQQQRMPVYVHNKFNPPTSPQAPTPSSPAPYNHSESTSDQNPRQYQHQQSWGPSGANGGPIQSRSFKVLQKITDTDNNKSEEEAQEYCPPSSGRGQWNTQNVPAQQLRKLQLSEDDRALMNKFKAQVDEDSFLHTESDPRYRGAAIPSRAFRMLQNMTEGMADYSEQVPLGPAASRSPQTKPSQQTSPGDGTPQPYIPPSEQQVQEPRKYTGGAIPSRSFRMLQAMTAPENCATVPSSDGRETPASLSHQGYDDSNMGQWAQYDPSYWGPEAWWGCYPSPASDIPENGEEYWDPFSAMYAYMAEMNAAYGYPSIPYPSMYPPHYFTPPRSARYIHGGSSDSDECSGYSSTDEMAYYGNNFARGMVPMMNERCGSRLPPYGVPRPPPTPNAVVTQTPTPNNESLSAKVKSSTSKSFDGREHISKVESKTEEMNSTRCESNIPRPPSSIDLDAYETAESDRCSDDEETTTDSDTEVEEDKNKENTHRSSGSQSESGGQLQTIRSVSDINVYKHDTETNEEESDHEEENDEDGDDYDDGDDDYDEEGDDSKCYTGGDECIPHQLSVIYEESEHSDAESVRHPSRSGRCLTRASSSMTTSEDGDSSTTLDNGDDESEGDYDIVDSESSTVTVRLPLKLKFSRSENDEEVTTVIVGDSQVKKQELIENATSSNAEVNTENNCDRVSEEKEVKDKLEVQEKVCADVSVTLCFPSKPNSSKKVEQWRKDSTEYDEDNTTAGNTTLTSKQKSKSFSRTQDKASTGTFPQSTSEELDVYETAESDSDVSVSLSLPLRKQAQKESRNSLPGFETISNISEEEDEDGKASSHCEDDSSSTTSIQTVRMASGSQGRSSGSEIETTAAADEGEEMSNMTDSSFTKCQMEADISESIEHETKVLSRAKKEDENEGDDYSSESGKNSTSSQGKEINPKKERKDSVVSSHNTDSMNEEEEEEEEEDDDDDDDDDDEDNDDSSDESDESEDGKEPDIIQKIYNLCTETEKASQKEVKQRNFAACKGGESECHGVRKNVCLNNTQKVKNEKKENKEGESQQNSKSQEESEEDDSGVTSDMSRQISDADTESDAGRSELSRLTRCQRASTHSRLFKLLQDECGKSDDEDEDDAVNQDDAIKSRREQLTLPLQNTNGSDPDSLSSSSGVTSPGSPTVTDRLVRELVHSLLQRKKGRRLKKLPLAKLHAAALRILQEDMDPYDTGSSEDSTGNQGHPSPIHRRGLKTPHHSNNVNSTANSTASYPMPPHQVMYGANYYDYCDYYDSWANAASYYGTDACGAFDYNIMPSRAFKLLSEHAQPGGFSSGVINGLWAKCPRIPSSKNLSKEFCAPPETDINNTNKTEPSSSSCPESAQASSRAT